MRRASIFLMLLALLVPITSLSYASYQVANISVNVALNQNLSARVNESMQVIISNQSVKQYSTSRSAINLTLSGWQQIVGPMLVPHIINPSGSIYGLNFLPGPAIPSGNGYMANIIMTYYVSNVTTVNQISPRVYQYKFNSKVFNFEHGVSGEILSPNTTLTISVPSGAYIKTVYPLQDTPPYTFAGNYKNITSVSWSSGEPLSKFTFEFVVKQPIREEVENFFLSVYKRLGIYSYIIIVLIILTFVLYSYYRAGR